LDIYDKYKVFRNLSTPYVRPTKKKPDLAHYPLDAHPTTWHALRVLILSDQIQ